MTNQYIAFAGFLSSIVYAAHLFCGSLPSTTETCGAFGVGSTLLGLTCVYAVLEQNCRSRRKHKYDHVIVEMGMLGQLEKLEKLAILEEGQTHEE